MKNKQTILLFIALINIFSPTTFLQAQQLLTKDRQEVQQAVVQLFEALSKRDSVSLKNHCTIDISLYEYGQVWNIDTLINKAITIKRLPILNVLTLLNSSILK